MADRFENLLEENSNLKRGIAQSQSIIDRITNDFDTLTQIHEQMKLRFDQTKRENYEYQQRNMQLIAEKKDLQNQFDTTIRNLKVAIEQKQQEIEEVQAQVIPSFDHDMLRIKIINELQIPHRQQLESKQEEIDKLNETIMDLKRKVILKETENKEIEQSSQRDFRMLKQRHELEISQLISEVTSLREKLQDNKDQETIKKFKREVEQSRSRILLQQRQAQDLRRERDRVREQKNEILIQFTQQLETEQSDKRLYQSESEKLGIRVKFVEEENQQNKIKLDSLHNDFEYVHTEKEQLNDEIRKKEEMIHSLQRRLTEIEDENLQSEQKIHDHAMKIYNEEHDKFLDERNKNMVVTRELEQLKKASNELEEENQTLRDQITKEISSLQTDNMNITDERDKLKRQLAVIGKDHEDLEKQAEYKENQFNELEREIDVVRRQYRDSCQKVQQLENQLEELNLNLKVNKGGNIEDSKKLIKQNQKLKEKLAQANDKIMELLSEKVQDQAQTRKNLEQQDYYYSGPPMQNLGGTFSGSNQYYHKDSTISPEDERIINEIANFKY